ncbi:MAG: dihydrolipoamide acetyltransferase family protein [Candidatus Binatia bacterium]
MSAPVRFDILLPELAESMTAANVLVWRKRVGEDVKTGDVLVEVETDKSAVEIEATAEGTLVEILVPERSDGVPVGTVLGRLAPAGSVARPAEPTPATPAAEPGMPEPASTPIDTPSTPASALSAAEDRGAISGPHDAAGQSAAGNGRSATAAQSGYSPADSIAATPLARRMAAQGGVPLETVRATGVAGRVTKSDIETALGFTRVAPARSPELSPASSPASGAHTPFHELRHSASRRAQASRLAEAKRTIPHFYLSVSCEVDALLKLQRDVNRRFEADGGARITLNDLLVRAVALALRAVPDANVGWTETHLRQYERVDLSVAVASERGLITPVVRDADRKSVRALAAELRDLTARARARKLRPEEYQGGTCTISNLGMYGVESLIPILNPPQSCILGFGAAEPRAVPRDGAVVVRTMMTCTLAADHRALDGATGARLLAAFRGLVEGPLALLL